MANADQTGSNHGHLHALLVEDNPLDAELVVRELERGGFEVSSDVVQTEEEFNQRIAAQPYDVILADYSLPQWRGMEALEIVRKRGLDIPVILVTGSLGDVKAVECIKQGATDYVLKDKLARLPVSVRRAIGERRLRQQQKRAEEALRQSQGQMETIIQSAMDAIIIIDEQQRVVLFNAAAEKVFRCSAAEAVNQSIDRFIPQRFRAAHAAHVKSFGETGLSKRSLVKPGELWAIRNDGAEFPMEASISRAQVGAKRLFTVILRDVTERRRTELELRASEERHRQLFERSASAIAVCEMKFDAAGQPCDYRFLAANPAFEQMTGLRREQVVDHSVLQLLPDLEDYWIELFGRVVTTGEPTAFEHYSRSLGRHYQGSAYRPQLGQFATSFMDVTERKRAEEALTHNLAELARSNRELEQFAYVASHDLQEPLRMVASYTQLLAEQYRGKLDEKADKYIGYAVEGALRMQALVQDLLAFSRSGGDGRDQKDTDCNSVLAEAIQNLLSAIEESGAVVSYGTLPVVAADRSQLLQVLQNLIGNAIKFRGKKPPAISVQVEKHDGEWQFVVTDNGIGIAPEHQAAIFVIFRRLHTRAEYVGNGIGLAICKKIVEHHGGRIWVESQPGQGSSFHFTLPIGKVEDEVEHNHETCTESFAG